jgi:hypothetical protein
MTISQLIQCMRLTPEVRLQPPEQGEADDLDDHDADESLSEAAWLSLHEGSGLIGERNLRRSFAPGPAG